MIFPDGLVYNKKNDDIEPLSRNEFVFVYDLKLVGYKEIKKDKPLFRFALVCSPGRT